MKILFTVEFYEPRKGGAEEVVKQLAERFVRNGHEVTVATSAVDERKENILNGVRIESFELGGNLATGIRGTKKEIARYRALLCADFDVVVNYAAQIWPSDLAFDILSAMKAAKVFVPCGYSRLTHPDFKEYFERLSSYLRQYDKLVYMSPNYQDKRFGDEHGLGEKSVIISNGAAEEEFLMPDTFNIRTVLGIRAKHLAISVSNHYQAKGHSFVRKAFRMMRHRRDTTLLIIGERVSGRLKNKVGHFMFDYLWCWLAGIFSGNVRLVSGKDRALVVSAYKSADLFLFGSRVECAPLVMYESFAGRALFISTGVGNIPDYADHAKIVKTPEEMARTADYYLDNEIDRQALVEKAFMMWKEKYTWAVIADEYETLFKSLCQK